MSAITCEELVNLQRNEKFTLLDVRLREVKDASPLSIAGAIWRDPEHLDRWIHDISKRDPVIVLCAHGRSISQGIVNKLNENGFNARFLEGGLAGWIEKGYIIL